MKIFVVYDSAAEYYGTPFFVRSTGEAIRSFTQAAHDPQTLVHRHPDQFTLFEIGVYDEQRGNIEMYTAHKSLGKGIEYLGVQQPTKPQPHLDLHSNGV